MKIQEPANRTFMNHANVDSNRMDLHRRIALVLRKEPGLVRDFAERLRAKLAMARCAAVVSDNEWEWIFAADGRPGSVRAERADSMSLCSSFCLTYMRYYSYDSNSRLIWKVALQLWKRRQLGAITV